MPLYSFEYFDENGERFEFDDFYSSKQDFNLITSPCGKYKATKILSTLGTTQIGLTANEKKAGTTKQRVESGKFMKEQRRIRKKTYDPSSRESQSNEIWTGKEGKDGVTQMPVKANPKNKKG